MGNRAHVIFTDGKRYSPAVYLHWNGGPESVYAFLAELERRGVRQDIEYAPARFVQIVGEFFSDDLDGSDIGDHGAYGLSLGILNGPASDSVDDLAPYDHGDNGVYLVKQDASGMLVRRFESRIDTDNFERMGLRELEPCEAAAEARAARTHAYGPGIREMFARLDAWRRSDR